MGKTVLVIANLDTRGAEFLTYLEQIREAGLEAVLMDVSMEQPPPVSGDIPCEQVARAGGAEIEQVRSWYRAAERDKATEVMIRGGRKLALEMFEAGRLHGAFGAGGATATLITTSIMRALPFGVPKVVASSVAGHPRYVGAYVGTRDITLLNTVVDVMGTNPLLHAQLRNAVGAICGMVLAHQGIEQPDRPVVGITSFGFAERCVEAVIDALRGEGFDPVPFHAQGRGDRAMDEVIRDGMLAGVVDVVTRGIVEEMLGGNCAAGPDRVLAAAECGVPMVLAPSGLDMLSVGGQADWKERFAGRAHAVIDRLRVEVRTSPDECREAARVLADRLNRARAPFRVVIPTEGWSSLDAPGRPLWDPVADQAFTEELTRRLSRPERVVTVQGNLYTPEFGARLAAEFLAVWREAGGGKR